MDDSSQPPEHAPSTDLPHPTASSQHASSAETVTLSTQTEQATAPSMAQSSTPSTGSQTLSSSHTTSNAQTAPTSIPPPLQRTSTNNEPRKCWICFADETEDTPTSTAWKSPCPCALTAHEACILDWVADLEAPSRGTRAARKIECPQCKGEIKIARPHSPIAEGVRRADRVLSRLTVPGIALTLVGSLTAGAWVHGLFSIYVVFGPEDFATLFGARRRDGLRVGSALAAGLVPMGLVLSKTSIADSVLPVIPVLFFATQQFERPRPGILWPPSPSTAFVTLPYVKGLYDLTWHHLFAAKEKQWIREVNPRAETSGIRLEWTVRPRAGAGEGEGENAGRADAAAAQPADAAAPAANRAANAPRDDGGNDESDDEVDGIELEIVADDSDDEDGEAGQGNANANANANGGGANAQAGNAQADNGNANANGNNANGGGGGNALDNANQLIDTGGRIADAVMGALCFPFVAAAAGELLRLVLPPRLVTLPLNSTARPTGLLQSRWGRSIAGGCLYVVVKDTLRLYARYRLAVGQRQRHVLDYQGEGGKGRRRAK